HLQGPPNLSFRDSLCRVEPQPTVWRERSFAGKESTCYQGIAGAGKRVQRVIQSPNLVPSQTIHAAIDRSEGDTGTEIRRVEVENKANWAEWQRFGRRLLEVRETVL